MVEKPAKMQTFLWEGINKRGVRVNGQIDAESEEEVRGELKRQGILTTKVSKKTTLLFKIFSKKISGFDIAMISRQLATLFNAGIPLIQAFDTIIRGYDNEKIRSMLTEIKVDVESGNTMADSLRKYPKYFDDLYCDMVRVGEMSGNLGVMLNRIADHKENIEALKEKVKKALVYPSVVLIAALLITAGMLIYVVPQFEILFSSANIEFPLITKMVIALSNMVKTYWWIVLFLIVLAVILLRVYKQRSLTFAYFLDKTLLKLPIVGKIIQKAIIVRFARTLAICFSSGMPIIEAMREAANAAGNLVYKKAILQVRDDVKIGQQLYFAMTSTQLFPNVVLKMVAAGEEAGTLSDMLNKIADIYERQVNYAVDNLNSLLEPMVILILGTLIGGLIIALYLPIFKMGMTM